MLLMLYSLHMMYNIMNIQRLMIGSSALGVQQRFRIVHIRFELYSSSSQLLARNCVVSDWMIFLLFFRRFKQVAVVLCGTPVVFRAIINHLIQVCGLVQRL